MTLKELKCQWPITYLCKYVVNHCQNKRKFDYEGEKYKVYFELVKKRFYESKWKRRVPLG